MYRPTDEQLLQTRLKKIVVDEKGCWLWTGTKYKDGYGRVSFRKDDKVRFSAAHRWFYEQLEGPIPDGLVLDHLCRVHNCVNPAHLEIVTRRENTLRGVGDAARKAAQTHCIRGHILEGDNLHFTKEGRRFCRACGRYRAKRNFKLRQERKNLAAN